jgi:hypothetical protein
VLAHALWACTQLALAVHSDPLQLFCRRAVHTDGDCYPTATLPSRCRLTEECICCHRLKSTVSSLPLALSATAYAVLHRNPSRSSGSPMLLQSCTGQCKAQSCTGSRNIQQHPPVGMQRLLLPRQVVLLPTGAAQPIPSLSKACHWMYCTRLHLDVPLVEANTLRQARLDNPATPSGVQQQLYSEADVCCCAVRHTLPLRTISLIIIEFANIERLLAVWPLGFVAIQWLGLLVTNNVKEHHFRHIILRYTLVPAKHWKLPRHQTVNLGIPGCKHLKPNTCRESILSKDMRRCRDSMSQNMRHGATWSPGPVRLCLLVQQTTLRTHPGLHRPQPQTSDAIQT